MVDAESEQFSLRWNNFHSNLTAGFHALLEGEDLVDVTLAAGGQFVQAHKIVLSVCSPYFKELFKVNPCKHPIVILKDVGHKELVAILHFMYQGEVNVRQDDLATFLKIAEMLQIKGLTGDDSSATNTQPSVPNSRERTPPPPPPPPLRRERTPPPPPIRREITPPLRQSSALSSILEPLVVQSEETVVRPFKRMRAEATIVPVPPPPAPMQTPTSSLNVTSPCIVNEDTSGVEFVEMSKPKEEPVDYESDIEEVDSKVVPAREDPLVQLLGGESSSQSHQDSSQGATPPIFASIPGLSQDSGGTPEGGQAMFVSSRKGYPKLLLNGYMYNKREHTLGYIAWQCSDRANCSARLWRYKTDPHQAILRKPHSHPPNWERYRKAMERAMDPAFEDV